MSSSRWTGSFVTASGAKYQVFEAEGDLYITRDCEIPVVDWSSGDPRPEIVATKVAFAAPPEVGVRFQYWADTHGGCLSTAVVEVTPSTQEEVSA